MKRFWIGITVLSLLLGSGLTISLFLDRAHGPISKTLAQAAEAALSEDLTEADALTKKAESQWDACRKWTAALVEHGILEEAECLFAEAKVYVRTGDFQGLAATCARLAQVMDAIAQSHHTSWQNVL